MLPETLLRKTLFARSAIHLCGRKVLPRDEFLALLTRGRYTPLQLQMTQREALDYLSTLKRSKVVVEAGQYIYTDAQSVVDAVCLKSGLPLVPSTSRQLEETRRALSQAVAAVHKEGEPVVQRVIRSEKSFWALTALGSAIQMLILSYLTFQVYGWNVMEPITFFVTTATALCSYAYFLYFRAEHTYENVDDSLLPFRLSRELQKTNIDADKVIRDITALRELEYIVPQDGQRTAKLIKDALRR